VVYLRWQRVCIVFTCVLNIGVSSAEDNSSSSLGVCQFFCVKGRVCFEFPLCI
jgi:hypothetical protein